MSAYIANNSEKLPTEKSATKISPLKPLSLPPSQVPFLNGSKKFFLIFVITLCLLPFVLNLFGISFASVLTPLNSSEPIVANHLFQALSGAIQHTLLEWSAVVLALLTFVLALVHYRIHRDIAIPIMGMAIFCAGSVDAFHTLAATRIISAEAANTDFIPFSWALSRIFNATIMIIGTLICFVLYARKKQAPINEADNKKTESHSLKDYKVLAVIGICL